MAAVRKILKSNFCGNVSGAEGLKLMENLGRKEENSISAEWKERAAVFKREIGREERKISKLRSDCFLPAKVHSCLIRTKKSSILIRKRIIQLLILTRESWRWGILSAET